MRLRNYLLALFGVSFGLLVLLFTSRTDTILSSGFDELHSADLKRVHEQIKAVVKSKQDRVEQIVWVGEQAPNLNLGELKRQAKVHVAENFTPGKYPSDPEIPWNEIETSVDSESITYKVLNHQGYPTLIGFIKKQGRILVIGFHFDDSLEKRVNEINNSQVKFLILPTSDIEKRTNTFPLYESGKTSMAAQIVPNAAFANHLRAELRHGLLIAGLLCLALFGGVLYLFLERGFLKDFRSLLSTSRNSVRDLEEGKIPVIAKTNHFISENSILALNLHTFGQAIEKYRDAETQATRVRMAEQVAHDLRSPVSALEMLINSLDQIAPDKFQAISGCLTRIKTMANSVLRRAPVSHESQSTRAPVVSLESIVKVIFEEKKVQYQGLQVKLRLELPKGSQPVFAQIREDEVKRAVSNLVDNAVEAIREKGEVLVSLGTDGSKAIISVKDTGRGIPRELISQIGERGFSSGKPGGTGLGLNFAMAVVADHRGTLSLESIENKGTTITIELPSIETPAWYIASVDLTRYTHVVITDDDATVHHAWDQKLTDLGLKVVHLYSPQELGSWIGTQKSLVPRTFFFCDYEFSENDKNGLDALTHSKLQVQSALVTGKASDISIQDACTRYSLRLVPKQNLLSFQIVRNKKAASKATRRKTA